MKIRLFTIPNMLTLANLLCGAVAVTLLGEGSCGAAAAFALVAAAAVFDFCDGFAARLLHSSSAIGVELDSLADMVSFGLVPALALKSLWCSAPQLWDGWPAVFGEIFCYVPLLIAAFSALRLAKFNVDDTQHTEFEGLPTPANALLCTSLAMLAATGRITLTREAIVAVSLVMSCMLISPVRMFSLKFKGFGWRENALRYVFMAVSACIIIFCPAYSATAVIVLYMAVSVVRWLLPAEMKKEKR